MNGVSFLILFISITILILFFYYVTLLYAFLFGRSARNTLHRDFYECGFKMLADTRVTLNIQFSLIGLIFLLYDIEIVLLVPIIVNFYSLNYHTYIIFIIIFLILAFSYWYEWEHYVLYWGFN